MFCLLKRILVFTSIFILIYTAFQLTNHSYNTLVYAQTSGGGGGYDEYDEGYDAGGNGYVYNPDTGYYDPIGGGGSNNGSGGSNSGGFVGPTASGENGTLSLVSFGTPVDYFVPDGYVLTQKDPPGIYASYSELDAFGYLIPVSWEPNAIPPGPGGGGDNGGDGDDGGGGGAPPPGGPTVQLMIYPPGGSVASNGPITVNDGNLVTVNWLTTNATPSNCIASTTNTAGLSEAGLWTGPISAVSGNQTEGPLSGGPSGTAITYRLTCTNSVGTRTDSVVVNVNLATVPNLFVSSVTPPVYIIAGHNDNIFAATVSNNGNAASPSSVTRFYIDGILIFNLNTAGIASGGHQDLSTSGWAATLGDHALVVCADADGANHCSAPIGFSVYNPLTVSCAPSSSTVPPNTAMNWIASVSGGNPATSVYTWGQDASGNSASVPANYPAVGTKHAQVNVNDGGQSTTSSQCSVSINTTPFIQTQGGDVHSNTRINVPGGQ